MAKKSTKTPAVPATQSADINKLNALIAGVKEAQNIYATFSQEKVDAIFKAAAAAADKARIDLAEMAVAETGMGIMEDKVIKNHFAAEYIYNNHKNDKTCGVIAWDKTNGIKTVAAPLGVIAGIIPTTNPTSTTIFKSLLSLKTRNAIIFSPHPRAKKCTVAAARLVLAAAVKAGAPENIIAWIDEPTSDLSSALLRHPEVHAILATGGPGMVKAAYSSGKPALGVGPGNTPAIIDETADINMAVSSIILSKTFDNGMICASEQAVIAVAGVYKEVKKELELRGAYMLNRAEADKLGKIILDEKGVINAKIVGQSANKIAEMAGLKVPANVKILVSEETSYSADNPYAHEKLSPVLTLYKAKDYVEAVDIAVALIKLGGMGHTSVLYTDERTQERIDYFANKLPTCRLLVNSPSSHGAIGDLYNFRLEPSLTLGCGSWGGNSVSGNVGVKHLLNLKTVAERKENMLWYKVPPKIYFKRGSVDLALREYEGKKRAFIVTDRFLFNSGAVRQVTNVLEEIGISYDVFFEVQPDPTLSTVNAAMSIVRPYEPDLIIALGGGSPMDAAKIIWLMYEQPETKFEDISMRFMDIRKRICSIPDLGKKANLVCIPTTSGSGSEVTPFAIITDDKENVKYAIADYALTPSMAIIDPDFVDSMPQSLAAAGGIDALVHAIEAYVSVVATNFTNAQALESIKQVFRYLPRSYKEGKNDPYAREKMHYAATIAGMSFANAFLGICHSLAHKIGAAFNIPHGIANALLICQVIRFNATDCPKKQAAFPQYKVPEAKKRYAQIAENLFLGGKTETEQVNLLLKAIAELKDELEIPASIKEYFKKYNPEIKEADFMAKLDFLVRNAFDDQCTGANPVYPLLDDLRQIYIDAYHGKF